LRHVGVPAYALTGPEKLLPRLVRGALDDGGPPEDVLGMSLSGTTAGLRVTNPYFDLTPLDLLKGVILPEGVVGPEEAGRRAADRPVHPVLADLLDG
jgi:translation initiation factor 2B subunit (eIF-2B alpha/beta/delta family)